MDADFYAARGSADDPDTAVTPASKAQAESIIRRAVPATGTPAEIYLQSRGLPCPDSLKFLPHARTGEGALVAPLTVDGCVVGVHLRYLTSGATTSLVEPDRQRFALENAPGAVFAFPATEAPCKPVPTIITEGVEDALSVRAAMPAWYTVLGVPGIGGLQNVKVTTDEVIIVPDGDIPAVAAKTRKMLERGIDALILNGAKVWLADVQAGRDTDDNPVKQDANSILRADGSVALQTLIERARIAGLPEQLSVEGEAKRLAKLPLAERDFERAEVLGQFKPMGLRAGTLEKMIAKELPKTQDAEDEVLKKLPKDEPWTDPVDLGEVLDTALAEVKRYIVAAESDLATGVAWSVHAHALHNEKINIRVNPRLAISAPTEDSGKTALLECVLLLSPRGLASSSFSAASVFRLVDAANPTLGVDDAHTILGDRNNPICNIVCGGHRKHEANVPRVEVDSKGRRTVRVFSSWTGITSAGIGEMPRELQSRAITLRLRRALAGEQHEYLVDGTSPVLVECRRKLAAWAEQQTEPLPRPALPPELINRQGDNWRILFGIAELAGGRWPDLIRTAALTAAKAEREPTLAERLLLSIRDAFRGQAEADQKRRDGGDMSSPDTWPDNADRLQTTTLLERMLGDPAEEWTNANRGKAVTAYWLRTKLRTLLDPPGAQQWYTGTGNKRQHHRGYLRLQFEDAWSRHLPPERDIPSTSHHASGSSGLSGLSGSADEKSAESCHPSLTPAEPDQGQPAWSGAVMDSAKSAKNRGAEPDAPDEPDEPDQHRRERGYLGNGQDAAQEASSAATGDGKTEPTVRHTSKLRDRRTGKVIERAPGSLPSDGNGEWMPPEARALWDKLKASPKSPPPPAEPEPEGDA